MTRPRCIRRLAESGYSGRSSQHLSSSPHLLCFVVAMFTCRQPPMEIMVQAPRRLRDPKDIPNAWKAVTSAHETKRNRPNGSTHHSEVSEAQLTENSPW
jgi:hypothetical protein